MRDIFLEENYFQGENPYYTYANSTWYNRDMSADKQLRSLVFLGLQFLTAIPFNSNKKFVLVSEDIYNATITLPLSL